MKDKTIKLSYWHAMGQLGIIPFSSIENYYHFCPLFTPGLCAKILPGYFRWKWGKKGITLKSLIIVQIILLIFGIFSYLHGLIRNCIFIYIGKKNSAYMVIGDKHFQIFLTNFCIKALFVHKHVFFKLWIHEFVNRIAFTCNLTSE